MNETILNEFQNALERFEPTDELQSKQRTADRQAHEFRERFPLGRLRSLRLEDYRLPYRNREDFCSWITTRTGDVVYGRIPWGLNKLGSAGHYSIGLDVGDGPTFEKLIRRPLATFVETRGREMRDEMHRAFGAQLMLKVLFLYFPESFINIVKVGWLDQIADAFGLLQRESAIDQSADIANLFRHHLTCREKITPLVLDRVLDDFIGLKNPPADSFIAFLQGDLGLGHLTALRIDRELRTLSNRLYVQKQILHPIAKIIDEGELKDLYSSAKCTSEETAALDLYRKFLARASHKKEYEISVATLADRLSQSYSSSDLASKLQANICTRKFIRHYTILSSLIHIVEDKCIRLTRGDDPNMNDQLEWRKLGDSPFWRRTFITCFSGHPDENAALWVIYGKPSNEAVRLSFSQGALNDWKSSLESLPQIEVELGDSRDAHKVQVPKGKYELLFGDVLYGGNLAKNKSPSESYVYRGSRLKKRKFKLQPTEIEHSREMTGLIKSSDWIYEDEVRLIVRIDKDAAIPGIENLDEIRHVYLPMPDNVLSQVEVMAGPCVPEKLLPILHETVERFGMKVTDSIYQGNLKFK